MFYTRCYAFRPVVHEKKIFINFIYLFIYFLAIQKSKKYKYQAIKQKEQSKLKRQKTR